MNDTSTRTDPESVHPVREPAPRDTTSARTKRVLLLLIGLGLLGGLVWYFSHRHAMQREDAAESARRPTATVAFAATSVADIPIRLEALGTVTPITLATVRPQVSGVITKIYYTEGQHIEAGKPLVLIDPRPFQLALDQAIAAQARDQAQLENARVILDRNKVLLAQDSIAQQDVDTQAATVKQLEGQVQADRAAVATARLNLEWSSVQAPISGRVGLRPVDVGNFVSTSDANGVASITQMTPIDVEFTLPAANITAIQERVKEGAQLPAIALDQGRTKQLGTGTFLTLDNQVDTQTGTVRAKARFANADGMLFPNQFVNVQLQLDTLRNAIVVPTNAIRYGPRGAFVYVIDAGDTARIRMVKVGPSADERTAVTQGLTPGERVVTEGGDRLTDGSTVRLPGQASQPANGGNPREGPQGTRPAQRHPGVGGG